MNTNKGSSLYVAVLILAILLGIGAGAATLLIGQLRTLRDVGDSTTAFAATDAGIEQVLMIDKCAKIVSNNGNNGRRRCLQNTTGLGVGEIESTACGPGSNYNATQCVVDMALALQDISLPGSGEPTYNFTAEIGGTPTCTVPGYCATSTGAYSRNSRRVQITK